MANPPFRIRKLETITPQPVRLPQDDDSRTYRAHLGEHELVLRAGGRHALHGSILVLLHDVVPVSLGERLCLLPLLVYRRLVLAIRREAIVGYGEVVIALLELVVLCHLINQLLISNKSNSCHNRGTLILLDIEGLSFFLLDLMLQLQALSV